MVVVGNWARVTLGVTPPRVLVLVTPPRGVEEVDQAEPRAIGKKRRFGKYGLARKAKKILNRYSGDYEAVSKLISFMGWHDGHC